MIYNEYKKMKDEEYKRVAEGYLSIQLRANIDKFLDVKIQSIRYNNDKLTIIYNKNESLYQEISADSLISGYDKIRDYIRDVVAKDFKTDLKEFFNLVISTKLHYAKVYQNIIDENKEKIKKLNNLPKFVNKDKFEYRAGSRKHCIQENCVYVLNKKHKSIEALKEEQQLFKNAIKNYRAERKYLIDFVKKLHKEFHFIIK